MRKFQRTLMSIEYAFVTSILASFSVVGIAGFVLGFQVSQWTEWQGIVVGSIATIAGVIGAGLGLRISVAERMRMRHHSHHRPHHVR